jgi:plastocyanin
MRRRSGVVGLTGLLVALTLLSCEDTGTGPPPAKALDSPGLLGATAGSQNYVHVFTDVGIYAYHCTYHTNDHHREPGLVLVQNGAQDSAFVSIFEGAFHPDTVTVRPNGQVRWQNFDDGVHHSVTSD